MLVLSASAHLILYVLLSARGSRLRKAQGIAFLNAVFLFFEVWKGSFLFFSLKFTKFQF